MSTLFRYLAKEIAVATIFLLLALLALFALFDLINELGDLGKGGYGLSMVLLHVTLSQPLHVGLIFPVAALLGTLYAISRLSAQSELTVMRASGLSLTRLAVLTSVIGIGFSITIFAFNEIVAPPAEEAAKRMKLTATSKVQAQQFRSGFWVKDDLSFVNIQSVTPETELIGLRIFEFDKQFQLKAITVAASARHDPVNQWTLSKVEQVTFDADKRARIARSAQMQWRSAMTPDLMSVLRVKPDEMSIANLVAYIDHLRENKQNSTRYEVAMWGKVFQPITVIVMMLLAIPFAINSTRAGGIGGKLVLGTVIGIAAYFLNRLMGIVTVLNEWPPFVSAVAPLLIFLSVAVFMLASKESASRAFSFR
jgi:lipopolysaccharide export system permease protein